MSQLHRLGVAFAGLCPLDGIGATAWLDDVGSKELGVSSKSTAAGCVGGIGHRQVRQKCFGQGLSHQQRRLCACARREYCKVQTHVPACSPPLPTCSCFCLVLLVCTPTKCLIKPAAIVGRPWSA